MLLSSFLRLPSLRSGRRALYARAASFLPNPASPCCCQNVTLFLWHPGRCHGNNLVLRKFRTSKQFGVGSCTSFHCEQCQPLPCLLMESKPLVSAAAPRKTAALWCDGCRTKQGNKALRSGVEHREMTEVFLKCCSAFMECLAASSTSRAGRWQGDLCLTGTTEIEPAITWS